MTDTAADYDWTGQHKFNRQAKLGSPSMVTKSLEGGVDITDSAVLLASNYIAAHDVRKSTDVAKESSASASWGGNFGTYIQHKVSGKAHPTFGTLTGAIRAQLETTQQKNGSPINDACAGYLGLYNNGTDVGGFGLHVDAYHAGVAQSGHSTYGMSAECWKVVPGGVMASFIARAQQGKVDYGLTLIHSTGSFNRGIQFGNPLYHQGGVQGSPGVRTNFDVGIDMTWGNYRDAALMVKSDDRIVLSGVPQPQDAIAVDVCNLRFEGLTGMFAVRNGDQPRFDVNMSTGCVWQNGYATWAAYDHSVQWAFNVSAAKLTPYRPSATPAAFLRVRVDGEDFLMSLYRA